MKYLKNVYAWIDMKTKCSWNVLPVDMEWVGAAFLLSSSLKQHWHSNGIFQIEIKHKMFLGKLTVYVLEFDIRVEICYENILSYKKT